MLVKRIAAVVGIASLLAGLAFAQSPAPGGRTQPPAPAAGSQAPVPAVSGQAPAPAAATQAPAGGSDADELSRQATDPTASLMAFNFINDVRTSFYGVDDDGFEFRFQPVVPFRAWKTSNILRLVVPYQMDGPGNEGLKSVSIFDLVVLPQKWGRLGIGPVMSLAESASSAESKFSIGPAVGGTHPVSKKLNVGLFNQNLFGTGVAISQLQPIIAYQLGSGWALSAGDLQYVYDWNLEEWVSLPIGFQIGKVLKVAGQPMRLSVNPQWNLKDITGANKAKIVFTATVLAPAK
jgi:hypothetical protein